MVGIAKAYRALARGLHRQADRLDRCAANISNAGEFGLTIRREQITTGHATDQQNNEISASLALVEAVSIARSMSSDRIDWSREPLTECEQAIRRGYLDFALAQADALRLRGLKSRFPYHGMNPAADLREALAINNARNEAEERERERIQDAIDELDNAL
jgi:hypothetical protein